MYQNRVLYHKIQSHWNLKEAHSSGETDAESFGTNSKRYGSLSLRYFMQVSGKRKDHRLENYKSNILIIEVTTPGNLRTGPMKRLKDSSDVPEARHGIFPKTYTSSEKGKAEFYFFAEEWVLPAASTKEPEEREFAVDSRASMHMVSKRDLNPAELDTMRTSRSPTTVMTANGEVQTREEATASVKQLDLFVKVVLLEETPTVLSLEKLCEDHGKTYHWTSGQKPHLIRNGKRIDGNISNHVPFVVPGLSASSSSTTLFTYFSITGFHI